MEMSKVSKYARALYTARGSKAEAEAAQKAIKSEQAGHLDEAATWRAVQRSISGLRGPHQG